LVCFACLFAAWVLGEANRTRYIILGAIAFTAGIGWVVFSIRLVIAQRRTRHPVHRDDQP
jgi:membrane associated rhomboid family serine protease